MTHHQPASFRATMLLSLAALASIVSGPSSSTHADEGLWTLDDPPLAKIEEDYGFKPDDAWMEHVRLASVRFNNGGSGSFVSGSGLVLTNHHVGFDCIQKLSTKDTDYVKDGFIARSVSEEATCPDMELNVLVSTEDVTDRITKATASAKDFSSSRKEEIAKIEGECHDATGFRCNVITLYGGGQYMLYRLRRHTDVRLVFAPEQQVAFFGGDFDNFTYPRFDLDVSIFRVYENGKPFKPEHWLEWSKAGPVENELVFVSGHPGSTGRDLTLAQMEYQRDTQLPARLKFYRRLLASVKEYAGQGEEQERQAKEIRFSIENALKAYGGYLGGLLDSKLFSDKEKAEIALREAVAKDKTLAKEVGSAWDDIDKAQDLHAGFASVELLSSFRGSELLPIAQGLVRLVYEKEKPNEKRLDEYRDSSLESLELRLFSSAPIYGDMEEIIVRTSLEAALEELGVKDPFVKAALGKETPAVVASRIVEETSLIDVQARKNLVAGGIAGVEKSDDPLVRFVLAIDPETRNLRKTYEDKVKAVEEKAGGLIAKARFAVFGKTLPPDATFTLRLSYGTVKGYEAEGTIVPWKTTFFGMYERYHAFGKLPPFDLPKRWREKEGKFKMGTPLNFVCTADIIGGNSGSPVINKKGEVVGLIFDGNIESLAWRYAFTDEKARAVAVHSSGIKRALYSIFEIPALAWELGRKGPPSDAQLGKLTGG